ncbi:MAG: hypothetical protein Q9208_000505 [Pyrenodesmia sp. 3 TL-2023]
MSPSTPPSIANPLRILVLTTSPSIPLPSLLQGNGHPYSPFQHPHLRSYLHPPKIQQPTNRTGSSLSLRTPYYSTTIPLWHDTIPSLPSWENEWLAPEAKEVIQSIGAWVVVVEKPPAAAPGDANASLESIRTTLTTLHRVLSHHQQSSSYASTSIEEPLLLAIGMPQPLRPLLAMSNDEWEDLCRECGGWEWIDNEATGKNEFGEKVGLERLQETLEANEWEEDGGEDLDAEDDDVKHFEAELGLRDDSEGAAPAGMELGNDFEGMHEAILGQDEEGGDDGCSEGDIQVDELESMMLKMQAIKEKGADMPEEERKRFAAKAVTEVMKSITSVK